MERLQYATSTPTVTVGAYTTGKAIGGMLTFTGIANRGFSTLYSATIVDKSGQAPACDLILFSQTFTPTADGATIAISAADALNCLGNIKFATTDWSNIGTPGVASKLSLFMTLIAGVDNNVYGQLVSRGTPTFVSTSDITVKLGSEIAIL